MKVHLFRRQRRFFVFSFHLLFICLRRIQIYL